MKLQPMLAAIVLVFPLIASATAPNPAPAKRGESSVVAQIRDHVFGWTGEQKAKRPAERVRVVRPAPGTKAITLNGLAPESLDNAHLLEVLADRPLGG